MSKIWDSVFGLSLCRGYAFHNTGNERAGLFLLGVLVQG